MKNDNSLNHSEETAKDFIEKFGFKKKSDEIINEKDDSLIPILSANLVIFAVSCAVVLNAKGKTLNASILLILISTIISLLGSLLNIWYLVRLKKRIEYLKEAQEIVFKKAESKLVKTFELLKKIVAKDVLQKALFLVEKKEDINKLSNSLENDKEFDFLAEGSTFIPMTIMELAINETMLNVKKCLNEPLNEKYSDLKLFIDRLSSKSKNWGLILSSAFLLGAILIKFIVG